MDLRQIRYFLAVVDEGGFTAAGLALQIAQPSLSNAIATLERRLGTPLFVRHPKGVRLTPAGEALVPPARQIIRDFQLADEAVSSVLGLEGGAIALTASRAIAVDPLAGWVGAFRRQYPKVSVRVSEPHNNQELITLVAEGQCELGFLYPDPTTDDEVERSGLTLREIGSHEYLLVCPPGTDLPEEATRWASLRDIAWVAPPSGAPTRDFVVNRLGEAGVAAKLMVVAETREMLLPLILSGAGVSMLPAGEARSAAALGCVIRPMDPPLVRRLGLIHRRGVLSPGTKALLRVIRKDRERPA
ncbi:LysR family transcriptional regulator [Demetria terragena]|uniref:LysR family transcriptional regulator n=1 Tax=Demetria terragena TaxID=63959 RepID=UPI000377891E|nr:LysR family transcriptional regulator [Demetria terragena]